MNIKKWLVHLCGGLMPEEVVENKKYVVTHVEMPIVTFSKEVKYDREFSPVAYIKGQIARELGELLAKEHLIEWQSDCNDSFIGRIRGVVRVAKPQNDDLIV